MDPRTLTHPLPSLGKPARPLRTHNWRARLGSAARVLGSAILVLGSLYAGGTVAFHGAYQRWGMTDAEVRGALPGDALVPHPALQSTVAVSIHASPAAIWPWLLQMGQDKAAFYSHTWAENLVGQHMRNADRIHPEWQHVQVGDTIKMGRMGPAMLQLVVEELRPQRALIFRWKQGQQVGATWQFVLQPAGQDSTRLLVRERTPDQGVAATYIWG